jgi:hypothetical protein
MCFLICEGRSIRDRAAGYPMMLGGRAPYARLGSVVLWIGPTKKPEMQPSPPKVHG